MNTNQARNYNCKDEELPVICGYAAFGLKRDLLDFTARSPKFNQARFTNASVAIAADNEKQYEMLSTRKELVQNNLHILNALFGLQTEICEIGKILYRKTAPEKVSEYTFAWLLKQVRIIPKAKPDSKKYSGKNSERYGMSFEGIGTGFEIQYILPKSPDKTGLKFFKPLYKIFQYKL